MGRNVKREEKGRHKGRKRDEIGGKQLTIMKGSGGRGEILKRQEKGKTGKGRGR